MVSQLYLNDEEGGRVAAIKVNPMAVCSLSYIAESFEWKETHDSTVCAHKQRFLQLLTNHGPQITSFQ